MKKYLLLFRSLVQNNLIRELEFRGNFFMHCLTSILWVAFQIFAVSIYFQYTDNLLGWTSGEVFILVGIFRISKSVFNIFVQQNFMSFPESVNKGDLDYLLTRPINTLYIVSLRRYLFQDIVSFITGIFILIFAFNQLTVHVGIWLFSQLIIAVVIGFIAFYTLMLFFVTLSIFFQRFSTIGEFVNVFSTLVRYPTSVYSRGNMWMEILLLPLAVIVSYPVQAILGKISPFVYIFEITATFVLFYCTYRFWNFALRHYSSASS